MKDVILEKEVYVLLKKVFSFNFCEYYDEFCSFIGEDEVRGIMAGVFFSDEVIKKDIQNKIFNRSNEDDTKSIWSSS